MKTTLIEKDGLKLEVKKNEQGTFDWVITSPDGMVDQGTCDTEKEALEMLED